jgi:plastocyanin
MRRLFALAISLAFVVALAPSVRVAAEDKKEDNKPKGHVVEMHDNSFKPKAITIAAGDTITWVNKGDHTHDAKSDDNGKTFDTKAVKKGQKSKPIKFEKAGKFPYVCTYHEDEMSGTVIVK